MLQGYWSAPGEKPRMAVVLHAATGVPAGYYRAFVEWLALAHGAVVLACDYRDSGEGLDRPLREVQTRMSDWGLLDQDAALSHAVATFPDLPVRVVGHSLGGHWLAFHDHIDRVDRVARWRAGPRIGWPTRSPNCHAS
jgi:predicted alpha/beta hydrolase